MSKNKKSNILIVLAIVVLLGVLFFNANLFSIVQTPEDGFIPLGKSVLGVSGQSKVATYDITNYKSNPFSYMFESRNPLELREDGTCNIVASGNCVKLKRELWQSDLYLSTEELSGNDYKIDVKHGQKESNFVVLYNFKRSDFKVDVKYLGHIQIWVIDNPNNPTQQEMIYNDNPWKYENGEIFAGEKEMTFFADTDEDEIITMYVGGIKQQELDVSKWDNVYFFVKTIGAPKGYGYEHGEYQFSNVRRYPIFGCKVEEGESIARERFDGQEQIRIQDLKNYENIIMFCYNNPATLYDQGGQEDTIKPYIQFLNNQPYDLNGRSVEIYYIFAKEDCQGVYDINLDKCLDETIVDPEDIVAEPEQLPVFVEEVEVVEQQVTEVIVKQNQEEVVVEEPIFIAKDDPNFIPEPEPDKTYNKKSYINIGLLLLLLFFVVILIRRVIK